MTQIAAELFDTHCHIHFDDYGLDKNEVIQSAHNAGVNKMICVGTTLKDSAIAVKFAFVHDNIWASVGIHPHEADDFDDSSAEMLKDLAAQDKVVAIGEIGLDYYYQNSSKQAQLDVLKTQIEVGIKANLPLIFHVRDNKENTGEVWRDFWRIFDSYSNLRGVVHSFSAHQSQLDQILGRNLYVGLNGIMTFTHDERQLAAAKKVPLDKLVLETDAPFLTPKPFRGKVCEPKHVANTARFLAELREESYEELAKATTKNALNLFKL